MKYYPEELNIKYNEQYFINGIAYDKYAHCESQDIFRVQVEMIQDVIGGFNHKMILDIGGALGWFAKRCQDKGAMAFCQDISEWACRNSPIPNNMRCGDAGVGILFKDEFFDIVTCIEALEHIQDTKHCFEEIARVLKLGGIFYCSIGLGSAPSHVWTGTIEEWEQLINDTPGLVVDSSLTQQIRQHKECVLQRWNAIIARRD